MCRNLASMTVPAAMVIVANAKPRTGDSADQMRPTPALEMNFAVPFVVPSAPMLMAKVSADTI